MEEKPYPEFLCIFGQPFKSFCMLMPLKSGVIMIAAFDLIIGAIYLTAFFIHVMELVTWASSDLLTYIKLITCLMNVMCIPFAFKGIKGIQNADYHRISHYVDYKIFEFFLLATLKIARLIISRDHIGLSTTSEMLIAILIIVIERIILLALIKVVWSAYTLIKNNQVLLVMYFEDEVKDAELGDSPLRLMH